MESTSYSTSVDMKIAFEEYLIPADLVATHLRRRGAIAKVKTALYGPLYKIPGPAVGRWTNLVVKYHTLSGRRMQYIDSLFTPYGE
jgi:hypothetical protein